MKMQIQPVDGAKPVTMSEALNLALSEELSKSSGALVIGEDVGRLGGVFRVTKGLFDKFGDRQVIDAPLGEAGIVGTSLGMALNGHTVIAEIQFEGFIYTALNEIATQVSRMQDRFDSFLPLNLVIRMPCGSSGGGIEHHQESPESILCSIPGLNVVYVSCPNDAYWILKESVGLGKPVVFLESKSEYWSKGVIEAVNPFDNGAPELRVVSAGNDVTILTWGPSVAKALSAAEQLERDYNVSVELIDLRYLNPVDWDGVEKSIRKTRRLVIVQETSNTASLGTYIAYEAERLFNFALEAQPVVVGCAHEPLPRGKLMADFLPSVESITGAVLEIRNTGYAYVD